MVDLNPIKLGTQTPNPVVYNYEDIQDGSGFVTFYGLVTTTSAGEGYILGTDSTMRSDPIGQTFANVTTPGTKFTATFTVLLNSARFMDGTALCNIPFGLQGSSATPKAKVKWTLIHLAKDGTTETSLGSVESQELVGDLVNAESDGTMFITLAAGKKFARGESIRCKVELIAVITGGTLNPLEIGHDPSNRTFGILTNSQIQFKIPVKIDV